MRVLIIGAGNAGLSLATRLCEEHHDVVMVDKSPQRLDDAESKLDIMTICGNGASPSVLRDAQVDKASLFAAVTDNDEVNILSALFARSAGVEHTTVRVSNAEYLTPTCIADLKSFGIELVVDEHEECALEMQRILNMPGSREVVEMVQGRILCVGMKVPPRSMLLDKPLQAFSDQGLFHNIRLIAVMRSGELIMPHGELALQEQDVIYCVGTPPDARTFLDAVHPAQPEIEKVVIAGGGDTGLRLAQRLEKLNKHVVLIEQNVERARICSAALDKAMVMGGSGLERGILDDIGISENTAFVTSTGDDENNIIACLLAKKVGAAFAVAIVSSPAYVPIINDDNLLDRAVSPYLTTINAILRFVRGTNIRAANLLHDVPGELLEVEIPPDSRWDSIAIRDLKLPKRAVIAALQRHHEVLVVTGNTVMKSGDRLIIFAPSGASVKLQAVFRK